MYNVVQFLIENMSSKSRENVARILIRELPVLHYAIKMKYFDLNLYQYFLENGDFEANLLDDKKRNIINISFGQFPYNLKFFKELCTLMLKSGADPNNIDSEGISPLITAASVKDNQAVRFASNWNLAIEHLELPQFDFNAVSATSGKNLLCIVCSLPDLAMIIDVTSSLDQNEVQLTPRLLKPPSTLINQTFLTSRKASWKYERLIQMKKISFNAEKKIFESFNKIGVLDKGYFEEPTDSCDFFNIPFEYDDPEMKTASHFQRSNSSKTLRSNIQYQRRSTHLNIPTEIGCGEIRAPPTTIGKQSFITQTLQGSNCLKTINVSIKTNDSVLRMINKRLEDICTSIETVATKILNKQNKKRIPLKKIWEEYFLLIKNMKLLQGILSIYDKISSKRISLIDGSKEFIIIKSAVYKCQQITIGVSSLHNQEKYVLLFPVFMIAFCLLIQECSNVAGLESYSREIWEKARIFLRDYHHIRAAFEFHYKLLYELYSILLAHKITFIQTGTVSVNSFKGSFNLIDSRKRLLGSKFTKNEKKRA